MAVLDLKIGIEHVRSLAGNQVVPIRPLTFLVGENSSGKSTLLATAACVFNEDRFPGRPPFNEPPFNLGTFETIATYKGGKYGRDETFTIGFLIDKEDKEIEVSATYANDQGRPGLIEYTAKSQLGSFQVNLKDQQASCELTLLGKDGVKELQFRVRPSKKYYDNFSATAFTGNITHSLLVAASTSDQLERLTPVSFEQISKFARSFRSPFRETYSLSPIRSKPKRTYDEVSDEYSPEGDHIPSLLARIFNEESNDNGASLRLRKALTDFGTASGMFRELTVKRLGRSPSDPFQVQVTSGGPKVNLIDVGYGVSQSLPVIVQSILRQEQSLLLIQQPEVHLHPRAQAALGSFFADLALLGQSTYIIETHSDYLIDRVRQEVARGKLKPEQVQILFFDRPKQDTTIYPISLDEMGNVLDAPEQYRQFFLEEELQLICPTVE